MNTERDNERQGIKNEVTQVSVSGTWGGTDTVYMSNNINGFTVMPLSPNQVNGQFASPTVRANEIIPFTPGTTIQLIGILNTGGGGGIPTNTGTFQYRNQAIFPYTIYDIGNTVSALASIVGTSLVPTFSISFATNEGTVDFTDAGVIFNTELLNPYVMRLNGSMGINTDPGSYALSINGDANVSGSLNIGSVTVSTLGIGVQTVTPGYTLDVSGAAQFRNTIDALANITTQSLLSGNQLRTTNDANIGTLLLVQGTSQLSGNVGIGKPSSSYALDVSGQMNVSDILFTNNLQVRSNIDMSGNIYVARQTNAFVNQGNVGIGVAPNSIGSENNSLFVAGNTNLQKIAWITEGLLVGVNTNFSLPANTEFYVNGASALNGALTVGTTGTPALSTFNGNIITTGTSSLRGALTVGTTGTPALSTFNGNIITTGTSSLQGALTVGTIVTSAPSIFNGDVTITGTLNTTGGGSQGSADISGSLIVSGTTTLRGTLDVSGTTILRSALTVGTIAKPANTSLVGNLQVSGNAAVSTNFDVSGTSRFIGAVGIASNLDVSGTSRFTGTVGMGGNAGIAGNLDVSGTSRFAGTVGIATNLDVSGTSRFTGTVGMATNLDVSGTSRFTGTVGMEGNAGITGNLDVSGTSLFTGNVGLSGTLDVSGTALITGNLNYNVYTERITYQVSSHSSVLPAFSPGYWEASSNQINLYMPVKPAIYIIDGSAGNSVDLSVNLVSPLPYTQPIGMTYTFVARNTSGAGHRLIYTYDTAGSYTTAPIPAPISTTLVCIGANNYSSTL